MQHKAFLCPQPSARLRPAFMSTSMNLVSSGGSETPWKVSVQVQSYKTWYSDDLPRSCVDLNHQGNVS